MIGADGWTGALGLKSVTDSGGFDSPPPPTPPPSSTPPPTPLPTLHSAHTTSTKDTERNQRRRRGREGAVEGLRRKRGTKSISGVVRAGGGGSGGCHHLFEVYTLPSLSFFSPLPLKSSLPLPSVFFPRCPSRFSPCGEIKQQQQQKKTPGWRCYTRRLKLRLFILLACPEESHNACLSPSASPRSSVWHLEEALWTRRSFNTMIKLA